jgi:eukaryotic-like serine/threonine-protein kinase
MATVLLAEDRVLRRTVAVKRLRPGSSADEERRILREARVGASLSHPALATIFDVVAEGDAGTLIVMEYVEGRALSELITPDGLEPSRVVEILRPVASALDFAHRHGVVHRDVKPSNILIAAGGAVKLVDLGAAIAPGATRITTENRIGGTLSYIAPERLAGAEIGGPSADVYSLAVTAFEALTGAVPLAGASPAELLATTAGPAPDIRDRQPAAPAGLAEALARGMDPDPGRRQATATELIADLEVGMTAATEPPIATAAAPGRPSRAPWLAAGALAAVAAATLAAVLLAGGGSPGTGGERGSRSAPAPAAAAGKPSGGGGRAASGGSAATATNPATRVPAASAPTAGAELNDRGYALIQAGNYAAAVPVLRRAVAAFPPGTTDINYAYALFNLGHALRLAGDPQAAVPVLEQRLRIPDQTAVVRGELDLARAAAGSGGVAAKPEPPGHVKAPKPSKAPKPPKAIPPGHLKPPKAGGEGGD